MTSRLRGPTLTVSSQTLLQYRLFIVGRDQRPRNTLNIGDSHIRVWAIPQSISLSIGTTLCLAGDIPICLVGPHRFLSHTVKTTMRAGQ
jgi:hypothetical protein